MDTRAWAAGQLAAKLFAAPWSLENVAAAIEAVLGPVHHRTRRALSQRIYALGAGAYPPSPEVLQSHLLQSLYFRPHPSRSVRAVLEPPLFAPAPALAHLVIPRIATLNELGVWLDLSPSDLDWFAGEGGAAERAAEPPLQHYRYAVVRKNSGALRLLEAPKPRLKALQQKILTEILNRAPAHPCAHGFVRGRSCLTGASVHASEAALAVFDLAQFFPTISRPRVHGVFRSLGYPFAVARRLAGLCTTKTPTRVLIDLSPTRRPDREALELYRAPHLPQGAPTSPALGNLMAFRLDQRLSALARGAGAAYTRYADDLAFSGDEAFARTLSRFAAAVERVVAEEGFRLNPAKTRIMGRHKRQCVTGIVVNAHCNVAREEFETLKAIFHNCGRLGADSQNRDGVENFRGRLEGRLSWVEQINPQRGLKLRRLFEAIDWVGGST